MGDVSPRSISQQDLARGGGLGGIGLQLLLTTPLSSCLLEASIAAEYAKKMDLLGFWCKLYTEIQLRAIKKAESLDWAYI